MHMSRWSFRREPQINVWKLQIIGDNHRSRTPVWQYNDHAHDLLTCTYMFLLKPTFYDIWFICNCILMAIILTWCLFICQVSSCPPLMGGRQSEFAISRSHAHISIGSFRLHRMYTQLPILSIYVLDLIDSIAIPFFFILVSLAL